MATVQRLNDSNKMNDKTIFGKAVWLSFAKAKEKQPNPQANAQLLHICFCPNAPRQFQNVISFLPLTAFSEIKTSKLPHKI